MGAHYNLDTTFGVTIAGAATPETAEKTSTLEVSEIVGTSGEIALVKPHKTAKVEVTVTGKGQAPMSSVTIGTVGTPGEMTILSAEQGEANKGDATFSVKAVGYETFTDNQGSPDTTDTTEPDIGTINIVSVSYAVAESVKRTREVTDLALFDSKGLIAYRAKTKLVIPFDIMGRGDLPAGIALGMNGASAINMPVAVATQVKLTEKAGDWNGWGVSGKAYPSMD